MNRRVQFKSTTPSISFIVAVPVGHFPQACIDRIRLLDFPLTDVEVLLAEGDRPSVQRNEAAARARGEVLYFLDDDSYLDRASVKTGLEHFKNPAVAVVGGPALTHDAGLFMERLIGLVMGSTFGTFTGRTRTLPCGQARQVSGEEFILCNLMIRRAVFIASGGFNPDLYPSEEPELMKRLRHGHQVMIYEPRMQVKRTHRKSLRPFMGQIFRYGRSRTWHIFQEFRPRDLVFFLPAFFLAYGLALPLLVHVAGLRAFLPLGIYAALSVAAAVAVGLRSSSRYALSAWALFPILHAAYGAGFWLGLLTRHRQQQTGTTGVRVVRFEEEEVLGHASA